MPSEDDFNKYLLAEYENIAEAHFRTISAISSFFRYYLLIMGLPLTLLAGFIGISSKEDLASIFPRLALPLAVLFLVISLVGFCVLFYIINLRTDALLYARTVNAIRKRFYDEAKGINRDTKLRMRVLPQSPVLPDYWEPRYFLPVVVSFALFNTLYSFLALGPFIAPNLGTILLASSSVPMNQLDLATGFSSLYFLAHVLFYRVETNHREHAYLRSYAMGVDIDGVLNHHRHHFCRLLLQNVGKTLNPDEIVTIPWHEDPSLGISRDDEKRVFNDPRYWIDMPSLNEASYNLKKLRNQFKLKILVFTHRDWPSLEVDGTAQYGAWVQKASEMLRDNPLPLPIMHRRWRILSAVYNAVNQTRLGLLIGPFALRPIDVITRCWLSKNGIEYDKLVIERGSEDVADPQGEFENRFYVSRKRKLRFFVEDDAEKATKLAYICDVVFLLNQPYNQSRNLPREVRDLPGNIVRVQSWEQIYRWIRRLS